MPVYVWYLSSKMSGKACWSEVRKVKDENRHELVLTGEEVSSRIAETGLDENIFLLSNLNFLEISKTNLDVLSDHVGRLENLQHLVLRGNKLRLLPDSIGHLKRLKLLDVSSNELSSIPEEVGSLKELQTLNASCNKLESFVDVSHLVQLHELVVSHNQLFVLPLGITCPELSLLSSVMADNNQLIELPSELSELPALKLLDVSQNRLESLPAELSECGKLKDLKVTGNPLKDRRLLKMLDQCVTKSVLEYLRNILEKERRAAGGKEGKGDDKKDKKRKGAKGKDVAVEEIPQNQIKVLHFGSEGSGFVVKVTASILPVRPYIVCCVVRNLDFNKSKSMMRRFLLLQTKLHDGICVKRQAATIATHDLDLVKAPLTYDAQIPQELKILPLGKRKELAASALVGQLRQEADEMRKEKKRNTVSGIHKYLDLLKDKTHYPCLVDASNTVISFPPITNSDVTKVSHKTRHVLVEVTSSQNLETCKKVMDQILGELLEMGIGCAEPPPVAAHLPALQLQSDDNDASDTEIVDGPGDALPNTERILVVEQVKAVDHLGALKVIYPSRIDLQSPKYRVVRDYE